MLDIANIIQDFFDPHFFFLLVLLPDTRQLPIDQRSTIGMSQLVSSLVTPMIGYCFCCYSHDWLPSYL